MNCSYNGSPTSTASPEKFHISNWEFWVDIVILILVVYITMCQIIVFHTKQLYKIHLHKITDVLSTSNLQSVMSFAFILSGLLGMSAIAMTVSGSFAEAPFTNIAGLLLAGYSYMSVYLILWIRQTMFHNEPSLKHLSSKPLHAFSQFQGCFVVFCGVFLGIVTGYEGFSKNVTSLTCLPIWVVIVLVIVQIETQLGMLLLFLIPMIRHKTNLNNVSNQGPPENLIRLMKRSIIITVTAVISDVTTFVVFFLTDLEFFYHSNIIINMICVLFCFNDWRERIFPWISICKIDQQAHNNTGQSLTNDDQTNEKVVEEI